MSDGAITFRYRFFSEILKGKNPNIMRRASSYRRHFGCYTISAITVAEVVKGFQKKNRNDKIQQLISNLAAESVLDLDQEAAIIAGRIYGMLEKSGQPVGTADPLIAGIAIQQNMILVTGNAAHFQRIATLGFPLRLDNWRM